MIRLAYRIARRLRLVEPGSRRSSAMVKVAVAGVSLSVAVMLLTVAIVCGFKKQITEKIEGFDSQITVSSFAYYGDEEEPVTLTGKLDDRLADEFPDAFVSLAVTQPGMLKTDDNFMAVVFRAFGPGHDRRFIADNIVEGEMPDYDSPVLADSLANSIVISTDMAGKLGLKVGDRIPAVFVIDGKMRMRNYTVAALYCSYFGEYDKVIAFAPIQSLQRLRGLEENQGTSIEFSGFKTQELPVLTNQIENVFYRANYDGLIDYRVAAKNVLSTGAMYFNWLDLLDANVVVIIILMAAISIFTLIASLFILILERVQMIGTLKTLGARDSLIRRVFIILASRIMLYGLLFGNVVGLGIIFLQWWLRLIPLDPEAYYISYVPVDISVLQIVYINLGAFIVALAVMVLPSLIITRMQPSRIIRFE